MLHPEKTSRGWELADETGTFEAESLSEVFPSKSAAQLSANKHNHSPLGFDELAAMERMHD